MPPLLQRAGGQRDHIVLFHVPAFSLVEQARPDGEIAEARFFPWDDLPAEATPATRRRIDEFRRGVFADERW